MLASLLIAQTVYMMTSKRKMTVVSLRTEIWTQRETRRENKWWPVAHSSPTLYSASSSLAPRGGLTDSGALRPYHHSSSSSMPSSRMRSSITCWLRLMSCGLPTMPRLRTNVSAVMVQMCWSTGRSERRPWASSRVRLPIGTPADKLLLKIHAGSKPILVASMDPVGLRLLKWASLNEGRRGSRSPAEDFFRPKLIKLRRVFVGGSGGSSLVKPWNQVSTAPRLVL